MQTGISYGSYEPVSSKASLTYLNIFPFLLN